MFVNWNAASSSSAGSSNRNARLRPTANAPLPLQMLVLGDILPGWLAWLLLAATLGFMLVSGWRAPH